MTTTSDRARETFGAEGVQPHSKELEMPPQLPQPLTDDLVLRAVESDADAEKVIAINAEVHGSDLDPVLRRWLFEGHPKLLRGDWLFVEAQSSGQAVATLSLMRTTWRYAGHPLPLAELGFVATRPDYRRRGLQRVLSDAFDQLALKGGYALAAIEGIPGFYGQFGYEYAVPLVGGFDLDFERVPEAVSESDSVMRCATLKDVSSLQTLYDASIASLDIAAPRDVALWMHQLGMPQGVTFYGTTTVIEERGQVAGYLRWSDDDWTDRLRILELAVEGGPGAAERVNAALRFAREMGKTADKRGIRLQLPESHPAVLLARYVGGVDRGYYGWQMKVLDPPALMWQIKSALEQRLAQSLLAGYSGALVFDLYRSRLRLGFEQGILVEANIGEAGPEELQADARMTSKQAVQLWLGWRGRERLEAWYPDFSTREPSRHLLDVLFPQAQAYIYTPY